MGEIKKGGMEISKMLNIRHKERREKYVEKM